ncbi:class I SAM-dependent RNA methyltransferase [Yoonia sp. 2307UL14-13]|uniref:class I SAM-dependent RNA methyltransferase n=1 Tax=Yoonia sp. 2307UL14-13 TaxID=3126506 RepID=UPI0030B1D1E0
MRIEDLTHHGLGRTGDDLIPRVLPGEEVALTDTGPRIITPSPDRVSPPCKHFKSCGGCAMQHARDDFVVDWKTSIVTKSLRAQGLDAPIKAIVTSPTHSRRRAKFSGRRTKKGAMVGFHAKGSDTVIAVPDCILVTPALTGCLPALEELTIMACSRKGEIALTVTDTANGPDIHVTTDKDLTPQLRIELAAFAQNNHLSRLVWNDEPVVMLNPPTQDFGGTVVTPPPGAFLQATNHGEETLLKAVNSITQDASRIIDLFAGCGTFSLPLARRAEIHAVEGEAAMLYALDHGWRNGQNLKRVTTETRDLFRRPLEPDELHGYDAAVIDPPRAGAAAQIATLARSDIETIAMVSCNPVTFARDAKTLTEAGFIMPWVQPVDQFRWSPHVELVAPFTRK